MIILFGFAGSGKSTQGQLLADKFGYKWLSVGQVLRNTGDFGATLNSGELVDDEVVIQLMNDEIEEAEGDGYDVILDGFPRDEYQAHWVAQNIADKIECAVFLKVPFSELLDRIKKRGRTDDTEEAVKKRFAVTEQNIYTILDLLKEKNVRIEEVDGVGEIEEINRRLIGVIRNGSKEN